MHLNEHSGVGPKLAFLLIGGGIGATLALLFAPKAGVDLRHDVADAARQGAGKTRRAARQVRDTAQQAQQRAAGYYDAAQTKVSDAYQAVLETAQNLPAQARQAVARQTEPVKAALEAGQDAYEQEKKSQASA